MRTKMVPLILSLALLTTMAPVALASDAGHTYHDADSIEASTLPAAYAHTAVREYYLEDVPTDAQLDATLTWEDDPTVDMDVTVRGPGGSCSVTPFPDVFCIAGSAGDRVMAADCGGETDPRGLDDDTEEVSAVTDRPGPWRVLVHATLLSPADSVDYELTYSVDEPHGITYTGEVGFLHVTPHCFLVE